MNRRMDGPAGMPVVALFPSSFAPNLGGVEELTARLAAGLRAVGGDAIVVTNRWPASLASGETLQGTSVHRLDFAFPARNPRSLAAFAVALPMGLLRSVRLIRRAGATVVHIQCVSTNGLYAWLAARIARVPLVVTLQGELTMDADAVYERSALLRRLLRLLLRRADAVTACSAQTLAEAEAAMHVRTGERGSVVYNGVQLTEFAEGANADETPVERYVFAVGRHVREKGFDVLVRAVGILAEQERDGGSWGLPWRCVIAGDGPERGALEALAVELGLVERIEFVGRTDRVSTVSWFRRASVFVLPSRHEPFGIVNVEAMASGTPIVATRVGGVPEIVQDEGCGLLVPPEDPAALATAIRRVLADPALGARLGESGRERARRYDWAEIVGQYTDVYARAADRRAAKRR